MHMAHIHYSRSYQRAYTKKAYNGKPIRVVREIALQNVICKGMTTHALKDRSERIRLMAEHLKDNYIPIVAFEVDRDENTNQIHVVFLNGVVEAYSMSGRLITTYCHKVGGMRSYWDDCLPCDYPHYYWDLVHACEQNYPIYKKYCKDADL